MKLKIKEIAVFGVLSAMMFASKMLMEVLPNIHLLGTFIIATTVVYRSRALYPIYGYVFLNGLISGFPMWWVPYLYVWTVLWGFAMLIPKKTPSKFKPIVYMAVCALHGFLFGILYAPAQAIMFGLDFKGMLTWIIVGMPFDVIHGISNFFCAILVVPIVKALKMADKNKT